MLSERRHPPIAYFQPVAETIGKPFTMSASDEPESQYRIRISQQPSGSVGVGRTFARPLIMECDPQYRIFFMAILSDTEGEFTPSVQLHGNYTVNGYGDESNHIDGGDSKRKRSSSSSQAQVEHAKFSEIRVPTKGRFTLTVQALQYINDTKETMCLGTLRTEAFDVV